MLKSTQLKTPPFSFLSRVHYAGYLVSRPDGDTGKYKSIPHHHRGEVQFLGRQVKFYHHLNIPIVIYFVQFSCHLPETQTLEYSCMCISVAFPPDLKQKSSADLEAQSESR